MEKLVINPYNSKEYMKMAMLGHEVTFREQVFELHRLYQTQKMLMKSIATSTKSIKSCNTSNVHINNHLEASNGLDLERQSFEEYKSSGVVEKVDESELELTLGPPSFHRLRKLAHPNAPHQLYFEPSFSSSTNSSHMKSNQYHQKINNSRAESSKQNYWRGGEMENGSIKVEENLRLNNKPAWFSQALSLNMT